MFCFSFVKVRSVPAKSTEKLKTSITATIAGAIEAILGHMWHEIKYQLNVFQPTNSVHMEIYWEYKNQGYSDKQNLWI